MSLSKILFNPHNYDDAFTLLSRFRSAAIAAGCYDDRLVARAGRLTDIDQIRALLLPHCFDIQNGETVDLEHDELIGRVVTRMLERVEQFPDLAKVQPCVFITKAGTIVATWNDDGHVDIQWADRELI